MNHDVPQYRPVSVPIAVPPPPPPNTGPRCGRCRFYDPEKDPAFKDGYCRRHAPLVTDTVRRVNWPLVSPDTDWCGEYETLYGGLNAPSTPTA